MTLRPAARKSAIAALQRGLGDFDHAAPFALVVVPAEAEIAHQLAELLQAHEIVRLILLGELDHQHRIRIALDRGGDDRPEHRDVAAEREHGAVDQLDRDRLELDQMLGRVHRLVKTAEMADAERLVADHGPQLQLDLGGEGEGALGADQKMRHVVARIARHQRIEIVAADPALHFWKARGDLPGLAGAEIEHVAEQGARAVVRIEIGEIARHLAEAAQRAVGERGLHRQRVVAHGAVAQATAAAGIVAGHAADGGARGRGDVDRKPEAVLLELAVEVVEHDAGLDHAGAAFDVERQDPVQVLREIDHEAVIDGLAALRGAAAARGDLQSFVARDRQRPQRLVHGAGHHHAERA